ncbi:MAG TPA: hypothetical protein VFF30_04465 [Nitrososphaerales archaeon]|nr:hypothetical protein [Nitrososphaerales archaeon]
MTIKIVSGGRRRAISTAATLSLLTTIILIAFLGALGQGRPVDPSSSTTVRSATLNPSNSRSGNFRVSIGQTTSTASTRTTASISQQGATHPTNRSSVSGSATYTGDDQHQPPGAHQHGHYRK